MKTTRPAYVPTCPRECHHDQWRNTVSLAVYVSPDMALDKMERAVVFVRRTPYLFRSGISF